MGEGADAPAPASPAGPRTRKEEDAELGERAPRAPGLDRADDRSEQRRLAWRSIARRRIGGRVAPPRRWRLASAALRAEGTLAS